MKKVYTLIAMLLITGISMAQIVPNVKHYGAIEKSSKQIMKPAEGNLKITPDTLGWTATSTPCFASPTASVSVIGMVDNSNNPIGYWFGTSGNANPDSTESDWWAQCWVNTANLWVDGVLFFVAGKSDLHGGLASSKVQIGIQDMQPYVAGQHGCIQDFNVSPYTFGPSPVDPFLASGEMNISALDTSFLSFNYISFASRPHINGTDICAVSNWKGIRVAGDTAYMMCDATGDGLGMHYSQMCMDPTGYYWVSCLANDASLDRNMSMFAVVEDYTGIEEEQGYFQGMKMDIRNNPARENTFVDYILQYPSSVKLIVYSMNGQEVMNINEGKKAAEHLNSITLNICDLTSGTYFVSLVSDYGRFTQKLIVE